MNAVKAFLAGGVAGAVAKSIIAPLERIKIMFQVSRMPFSTAAVLRESRRTVAEEGFTALYRGNGAQVLRVYPYSGIQLMTYDQVSKAILAAHNRGLVAGAARDAGVAGRAASGVPASGGGTGSASRGATITKLTAPEKLLAGSIAGATSVVFTYPLDLLRARLAVAVAVDAPLPSLWTMLRTMVARGGVSSLYVGVTPTLIGILPYAGISYAVFETGKQVRDCSLWHARLSERVPLRVPACAWVARRADVQACCCAPLARAPAPALAEVAGTHRRLRAPHLVPPRSWWHRRLRGAGQHLPAGPRPSPHADGGVHNHARTS